MSVCVAVIHAQVAKRMLIKLLTVFYQIQRVMKVLFFKMIGKDKFVKWVRKEVFHPKEWLHLI